MGVVVDYLLSFQRMKHHPPGHQDQELKEVNMIKVNCWAEVSLGASNRLVKKVFLFLLELLVNNSGSEPMV